jgi:hypothetical protein
MTKLDKVTRLESHFLYPGVLIRRERERERLDRQVLAGEKVQIVLGNPTGYCGNSFEISRNHSNNWRGKKTTTPLLFVITPCTPTYIIRMNSST